MAVIDCDTAYCVACSDDSKPEIIASNIHDVNKNIHVHACMHAYIECITTEIPAGLLYQSTDFFFYKFEGSKIR